ncbi:MAG TPA: VOC family protein [Burkholderiales bacterium]|nr:VOC family protein [Burkholderiales bacterium]
MSKITPCLWFDNQAEEAAMFYTGIFKNSRIVEIARYGEVGQEIHGGKPGSVMTVAFELEGQSFTGLNGGPVFKFNEAISLQVDVRSQDELDYYWNKLNEGGDPNAQQCGWLKDKFGVSWQIVPRQLIEMILDKDKAKSERAFATMLQMKKLDIAKLETAYRGA